MLDGDCATYRGAMTARHGSESFFIEGEGLVNTQVGGRSGGDPDPISEPEAAPAAALPADAAPPFRFSRVGPRGTSMRPALIEQLAVAMTKGGGGTGDVPAGYT